MSEQAQTTARNFLIDPPCRSARCFWPTRRLLVETWALPHYEKGHRGYESGPLTWRRRRRDCDFLAGRQPLGPRPLAEVDPREERNPAANYVTSRTCASGRAATSRSVPTGKTACGVPPAHHTVSKR